MRWLHRHVDNLILTRLINLSFGLDVADAYCGMRMFRRSAVHTSAPGDRDGVLRFLVVGSDIYERGRQLFRGRPRLP
jgi:hypothetical protein